MNFDAQVVRLAERQHLVFALWQLEALGLGRGAVAARARCGRLHRIHHAVYGLVPRAQLTVRGRYLGAVLAIRGVPVAVAPVPPGTALPALPVLPALPALRSVSTQPAPARALAALGHRSAGDLQGLRACHRRVIEVIVPGRTTHRHAGIEVHRATNLDPVRDLTTIDRIPVTTVARTLLDLAGVLRPRELERALDQAEQMHVFDLDAFADQLQRNPRHPGAGRLAATLDRHTAGDTVTDSELEERMHVLLQGLDLPQATPHEPIDCGDGGPLIRPDFVWRDARLAVEVDGRGTHLTRRGFETDRRRDQRLVAAGWRVIRITWRQLVEEPERIARMLVDVLREAAAA